MASRRMPACSSPWPSCSRRAFGSPASISGDMAADQSRLRAMQPRIMRRTLRMTGLTEHTVLIGHSLGARNASGRRGALSGESGGGGGDRFHAVHRTRGLRCAGREGQWRRARLFLARRSQDLSQEPLSAPARGRNRAACAARLRMCRRRMAPARLARGHAPDVRGSARGSDAFPEEIGVPVLLLRGAESKLVSREAWARTKALRPDLPAQEIADADHYVP